MIGNLEFLLHRILHKWNKNDVGIIYLLVLEVASRWLITYNKTQYNRAIPITCRYYSLCRRPKR